MLILLLHLLLGLGTAEAGATWRPAPEPLRERPAIEAPAGGWWTEDGVYAQVRGAHADRRTVERLADHAASSIPRIARRLELPAGVRIDIYVAASQGDFARIQPGEPPDWADGTAYPEHALIFLRAPSVRPGTAEPLEQVLDHEIVHVLLGQAFLPRRPPRWLQEGVAQVMAGELGPETARTIGHGGDLFHLDEITRTFPDDPIRARMAYAVSADFMGFIEGEYGAGAVRRLVARMAAGDGIEDAIAAATGSPLATVESAWRGGWEDRLRWLRAEEFVNVLWGIAAVAMFLGAWRVRRRNRVRLARMEREERWQFVAGETHPLVH